MFIESYRKLKHLFDNEEDVILYIIDNNYINKHDTRENCKSEMKLYLKKKLYECKNYKCRMSISPFKIYYLVKWNYP